MTFIIKLTEQCNLCCSYCYIDFSPVKYATMPLETARWLFKRAFAYAKPGERIDFVFHGGEPLLVGIDAFRQIIAIQEEEQGIAESDITVWNGIQTNGTLINRQWARLFKTWNIDVGISLDFPKTHHDRIRRSRSGESTFDRIVENINLLRGEGIRKVGILTILTKANLKSVPQMYEYFRNLNVSFRPNVYFPDTYTSGNPLIIAPDELANSLISLFDLWYSDTSPVSINLFEDIVESMIRGRSRACTFLGECMNFYGIRPNGDVFICDRFTTDDFRVGNIRTDEITEFAMSDVSRRLLKRQSFLKECLACHWYEICKGGCPSYSYSFHGTIDTKDYYCETRKSLFSHIYSQLRQEVEHEQNGSPRHKNGHENQTSRLKTGGRQVQERTESSTKQ